MQRVVERILNLLAFLLTVTRPVTAEEIRHTVAGYDQPTDEAFRRTFERDKDLLRSLGVPLQLQPTDKWEVEHGYWIPRDEYAIPDPGLDDEERTALWLAAQVVRLGGQASGPEAIFKLGGAAMAASGEPLAADLGADAEALGIAFEAVSERRIVRFGYRGSARTLRPYGLLHRRGHWYLTGAPAGSDEVRAFRIDRMEQLEAGEESDAFVRPEGFSARDAVPEAPWEAGDDEVAVEVRFDPEVAWWARRQLTRGAEIEEESDGGLRARLSVANVDALIGWLIGFDDKAEVVAPDEVRRAMVTRLQEVAL